MRVMFENIIAYSPAEAAKAFAPSCGEQAIRRALKLGEPAFGSAPTMKARGELLNAIGQDAYTHTARLWGATASNLRPGKPPAGDDDDAKVRMSEVEKPAAGAADSG